MFAAALVSSAQAQKQSGKITAYVITSPEKGGNGWSEVKLVDLLTGEAIQSVYESNSETEPLNARTKKPVVKHDAEAKIPTKKTVILPLQPGDAPGTERKIVVYATSMLKTDQPFATNSAACAYDEKHERLYYTPMGINQLRYIDLTSNKIYYFEDEPLGVLSGPGDMPNQVTRMVIAADGNGYGLTNNGDHLIRFTTNKKAKITDLGALTDDASNGSFSIHSKTGYGGDMVADESGNLYLFTASRNVFKVNIESKTAKFIGTVKGLPDGFTTNGAAVEKGTTVILSSATMTKAYYRVNLKDLQATKIPAAAAVYNASDLANATLVTEKWDDLKPVDPAQTVIARTVPAENVIKEKISVYPNPVSTGTVKVNFTDYAAGEYELQLVDLSGKVIRTQSLVLNSKVQVQDFAIPPAVAKGAYLLKVISSSNKVMNTEKIIVE